MRGGCLCGAIRFEVNGPSNWCAHCHCTICQQAHGAAFVTWVGVPRKNVNLAKGEDQLKWHPSSESAERGFCTECGSTLFFRGREWPGELHIVRANFEGEIDRKPQANAYFNTHVNWAPQDRSLPSVRSG